MTAMSMLGRSGREPVLEGGVERLTLVVAREDRMSEAKSVISVRRWLNAAGEGALSAFRVLKRRRRRCGVGEVWIL